MKKENHFRFIKLFSFVATTALFGIGCLHAEQIGSVLVSPASYHHKRVSLVGILRGHGPIFELYDNITDAIAMRAPKSVWVITSEHSRQSGPYDLRRVRVTGIVDANRHGIWGNPCSLSSEKIEILSGPVAPWPDSVGIFRNDRRTPVFLRFGVPPTDTEFTIQPEEHIEVTLRANQSPTVRAFWPISSLVAKTRIVRHENPPYYDPLNAALYYRITDSKIEQVLPAAATSWGWRR